MVGFPFLWFFPFLQPYPPLRQGNDLEKLHHPAHYFLNMSQPN